MTPPHKKAMSRYRKLMLGAFILLAMSFIVVVVLISTVSWSYAKPWINRQASAIAHRPAAVNGELTLRWVKPIQQTGWRQWLPWPEIRADHIMLGNPRQEAGELAQIDHLTIVFNPWALFGRTVQVERLNIQDATLSLERRVDKSNNWTFGSDDEQASSDWTFDLRNVTLKDVVVELDDRIQNLQLNGNINSTPQSSRYGLSWTASGTYRDAAVQGKGQLGDILALRHSKMSFPVQGDMQIGTTTINVEGAFTKKDANILIDVNLKLAGDTMHDLFPITGVVLPNTPPYHTEGRLIRTVVDGDDAWRYEGFEGIVGKSDLAGTLEFRHRDPRSLLTGEVESKLLRLRDLGPLIGVDTSDTKGHAAQAGAQAQPPDKALPVERIATKHWGAMDADVKFSGHKILRNKDLPLDNITAHVQLRDRVLSFTPLNFGIADGTLSNTISLDGRGEQIDGHIKAIAKHLKLKELFPGAQSMDASFGQLQGNISLTGRGVSVATLLAHANGNIQTIVSRGTISKLLLETAGLNIANIVFAKLFGDQQIILNCMGGDFKVTNGLVQTRVFRMETEDAIVDVTGQINLATEHLDLDIRPQNKTLRIFTLRSPLYVKGTFKNPDVGVQKGPLAARAGAAIALGVIATPFAALLPLLNFGTDDSGDCDSLLASVQKRADVKHSVNGSASAEV
ncbi:AsmA family protein [Alcaligenaceae bacterium CGII-47]|nr:AsmA family protein [Alcaligenaceae bacterium CGII-47]